MFHLPALLSPSGTTAEIISAINRMVEQDFSRQERVKYQEARTRYIQIRLSEVAVENATDEKAKKGAQKKEEETPEDVAQKRESGELTEDLQDSVFYSTSPCHVFRETTV